jgi:hypothetical protein
LSASRISAVALLAKGYGIEDSPIGLASWMLDHDASSYELIASVFDGQRAGLTRDDVLDNTPATPPLARHLRHASAKNIRPTEFVIERVKPITRISLRFGMQRFLQLQELKWRR